MKLSDENIERLKDIHEKELLAFLDMAIKEDINEFTEYYKERIKKKLLDLKINIGYILTQYLEEKGEKQ